MAAADTWATAITLSAAIENLDQTPDIVFAGFKTADGETGHTGPQTNWCLDMPLVTHVISLDIDEEERVLRAKRLVEGDIEEIETVEVSLPAFVVADPEFVPSYRSAGERLTLKDLRAETQERAPEFEDYLTVWDHTEINVDPDYIGLDGSPTIVSSVDPIPKAPAEREATMVDPGDTDAMSEVLEAIQSAVGGDTAAAGGD
jgi:electron transfer flavoprotein beta subunit